MYVEYLQISKHDILISSIRKLSIRTASGCQALEIKLIKDLYLECALRVQSTSNA